jgi:hypothetical protein
MRAGDEEHWSEANALLRVHGKGALQHASDQITMFMHEGNDVEMLRWFEIHEQLGKMLAETLAWPIDRSSPKHSCQRLDQRSACALHADGSDSPARVP